MIKTSLVMFMATIMVVGVIGTNYVPDAEALKGKGVSISQYGSATDVCGLVLCSDYPGGKDAYKANWASAFTNQPSEPTSTQQMTSEPEKMVVSSYNVDEEYPAQLDAFIHKFELDKISADEALDGIKKVHNAYMDANITSDIIEGVDEKLKFYYNETFDAPTAVEAVHLTAEPQNVNPEYQGALDEVIHKFELDKISADEAITGIKEVHEGFTGLYITSDLIEAVDETISLIDSGALSGADAVEAVHLTAEPQNVNPEYQGALDEVIHKFELDKISADEAITGIKEVHEGFTGLYITSDVIDSVGVQINIYDSGNDSSAHVLEVIHEVIEQKEAELAALHSVDGEVMVKELPPNTVDMPVGAGVPGCEENDMCYTPKNLTVSVGTTVTWINSDGAIPHTVTAGWPESDSIGLDYPGGNGFDSDFMSGGATFEHTFEVPGEYDYYCLLHPWMIGAVTVE